MRATSEKYRLNSYDGEELPFENYMKLDNTNPAPDEVANLNCQDICYTLRNTLLLPGRDF